MKNFYAGLIRLYAAYNLRDPNLYSLAEYSFGLVLFLFLGEYLIWKTARLKEAIFPFVTAGLGLAWMRAQRDWYVR